MAFKTENRKFLIYLKDKKFILFQDIKEIIFGIKLIGIN